MLRRCFSLAAVAAFAALTSRPVLATDTPAALVPPGIQLPFEPDAELLARLRAGSCWSEFRLYDPATKSLGEVVALEWYDKLDQSVARLYLRQDARQRDFIRTAIRFKPVTSKAWREGTGDEGPDSVGTQWTTSYAMPGKARGGAVMRVVEGMPDDDEHVSVGVLTLPGVFPAPVNVAHSAGCNRL